MSNLRSFTGEVGYYFAPEPQDYPERQLDDYLEHRTETFLTIEEGSRMDAKDMAEANDRLFDPSDEWFMEEVAR